jgi:hypothetical protein
MSVWLCIPSARPPEEAEKVLKLWRERGYKIHLWRDPDGQGKPECDLITVGIYPGYAHAVNCLVQWTMQLKPDAQWFVTGGDDVEPDMNHSAEEIARECGEYFWKQHIMKPGWKHASLVYSTFGVMQPTGDKWGDRQGPYIERVCGSPWMGREFCRRMYQGKGPLCEEYFHMFEDEELQHVATKLGVLWQRPDLIHLHNHWGRKRGMVEDMPPFLEKANLEMGKARRLFQERQAAGFPGHEPLEA